MRLNIEHHIHYAYPGAVDYTIQQLHLTPQDGFGQRVRRWEIRVNGRMQPYADTYGNLTHTLVVDGPHSTIDITACGEVETEMDVLSPPDLLPLPVYLRATQYTTMDAKLEGFARQFGKQGAGLDANGVQRLMHAVRNHVIESKSRDEQEVTAAVSFAAATGNNRDRTHVFIACCRHLGVPARYVSGYVFSAGRKKLDNHSWADVWINGAWLSYDIDRGQSANGIHVRLAVGLDGRDAGPICAVQCASSTSTSFGVLTQGMEQHQQ